MSAQGTQNAQNAPGAQGGDTRVVSGGQDAALSVNEFLAADRAAANGDKTAAAERGKHLSAIESRYFRGFYTLLSAALGKRRATLNFSDEERLFMDLGLVDARMVDPARPAQAMKELLDEINSKSMSGCQYLTEWLVERYEHIQLENALTDADDDGEKDDSYGAQLAEARRRVLSRLESLFTGLPGIPLEVSESMRSGDLDRVAVAAGITAVREPTRKNFLRRHHLWALREQILGKARARANGAAALKLFDLLGDIYSRDFRARFDALQAEVEEKRARTARISVRTAVSREKSGTISVSDPNAGALMSAAREMRMRTALMNAADGRADAGAVLDSRAPRVTKRDLAALLPLIQTFDRAFAELPPVIIVPGTGRGMFAWEAGCVLLALRPVSSVDDSVATAFALHRMLDDRMNRAGALRLAYEKRFPGAVFQTEFPADYRAWMTRLTKGDAFAMHPQRRVFFREIIGPDVTGPMLPPNLRNVGVQTLSAICRRLEKQIEAGDADVRVHRRLAAIYWRMDNAEAAGLQFNAAIQASPDDGETLFSAGMFMRSRDDAEAANDFFRWGRERAAGGMWGIYCQDALANLL